MAPDSQLTTPPSERLITLDVLRGIAIFGILLVNIHSFGLPNVARLNPSTYGSFTGLNYASWAGMHIVAEGKFITIFTILFGAGILLFTDKKDAEGTSTLTLHYRRMFWLLIIGLLHAYLLWDGDILVPYAIAGSLVVLARNWTPTNQLLAGIGIALFKPLQILSLAVSGTTPSSSGWNPSQAAVADEIAAHQAGWATQAAYTAGDAFHSQTLGFISGSGWQIAGLMLIGMAMYRFGVLSGDRSTKFYTRLAAIALPTGLLTSTGGVLYMEYAGWTLHAAMYWSAIAYVGGIITALGYIALIVLFSSACSNVLTATLAAVGRTALSNYVLQSILATTIFYGHGLGLFGTLTRQELLPVVLGIWAVQVAATVAWLHWFDYGPLERVWRHLTYRDYWSSASSSSSSSST